MALLVAVSDSDNAGFFARCSSRCLRSFSFGVSSGSCACLADHELYNWKPFMPRTESPRTPDAISTLLTIKLKSGITSHRSASSGLVDRNLSFWYSLTEHRLITSGTPRAKVLLTPSRQPRFVKTTTGLLAKSLFRWVI